MLIVRMTSPYSTVQLSCHNNNCIRTILVWECTWSGINLKLPYYKCVNEVLESLQNMQLGNSHWGEIETRIFYIQNKLACYVNYHMQWLSNNRCFVPHAKHLLNAIKLRTSRRSLGIILQNIRHSECISSCFIEHWQHMYENYVYLDFIT